jgi:hypothetical protein
VDALPVRLRAFAHLRGLVLADVYTEQVGAFREGVALRALVMALRRSGHLHGDHRGNRRRCRAGVCGESS